MTPAGITGTRLEGRACFLLPGGRQTRCAADSVQARGHTSQVRRGHMRLGGIDGAGEPGGEPGGEEPGGEPGGEPVGGVGGEPVEAPLHALSPAELPFMK